MLNWTVGCIQREVFAEHIKSQPRDPHVCSVSTRQTTRASLEWRGQKGFSSNLVSLWGDGLFKCQGGMGCQASLIWDGHQGSFIFILLSSTNTDPGELRGTWTCLGVCLEPVPKASCGEQGEGGGGPLAVLKTETQSFYAHD